MTDTITMKLLVSLTPGAPNRVDLVEVEDGGVLSTPELVGKVLCRAARDIADKNERVSMEINGASFPLTDYVSGSAVSGPGFSIPVCIILSGGAMRAIISLNGAGEIIYVPVVASMIELAGWLLRASSWGTVVSYSGHEVGVMWPYDGAVA